MLYALKEKNNFNFNCIANTIKDLEDKIEIAYYNWKSCQSRNKKEELKTKEVFLQLYVKVKITIKPF